jgi:GrpB-like predicted nucleotidyltransferase (UPF0157 family)
MKKYDFKPYNPNYPAVFEIEKKRLSQFLTGKYQIEHIGSTAVPNLGGKGIVDIMIGVSKDRMEELSKQAQKAGYIFRPLASTPERLFLRTEYPEDFERNVAYHIHITYPESDEWKKPIVFRDYLRTHPEAVKKYSDIKQKAAQKADEDKNVYMKIKESVINEILNKALNEKDKDSNHFVG